MDMATEESRHAAIRRPTNILPGGQVHDHTQGRPAPGGGYTGDVADAGDIALGDIKLPDQNVSFRLRLRTRGGLVCPLDGGRPCMCQPASPSARYGFVMAYTMSPTNRLNDSFWTKCL